MIRKYDTKRLVCLALLPCLVLLLCVFLILICCQKTEPENPIHPSCSVGEYVTFGSYMQKTLSRKKQPIEWLVLAREDEKALLISRYALTCRPFDDEARDTKWRFSSLRFWLNNGFFTTAFNAEERMAVLSTTTHKAVEDPWRSGVGKVFSDLEEVEEYYFDRDTTDRVFLLSVEEAERYFKTDEERACKPTDRAVWLGGSVSDYEASAGNCWWWLRSTGFHDGNAAYVVSDGSIYARGRAVGKKDFCVRPAIWVDLGAISSQ